MKFKVILDIEHLVDEGLLTGNTPAELLNFSINIIE